MDEVEETYEIKMLQEKLALAENKLQHIKGLVMDTERICEKYPDPEGPISCGWKSTVRSIETILE